MARHDYSVRPEPRWEDGFFVPPSPVPMPKPAADWNLIDVLDNFRAMSRNPISGTTRVSITELDAQGKSLGISVFVATSPEAIRHIFIGNAANYGMHPVRQAILRPALRDGLVSAEGDIWRRARRALAPVFAPRNTDNFARDMQSVTEDLASTTFPEAASVEVDKAFLKLTYAVLSQTLFSGEVEESLEDALTQIDRFMSRMGQPDLFDILGLPDWLPRLSRVGTGKVLEKMRRQIRDLANSRRRRIETDEFVPQDFLTLLLTTETQDGEKLSNEQVEDQIITFIGAGHETTSRAMTWLTYLLSQDTAVRDRFEAEIDALDMSKAPETWVDHLPYAMACFNEGMRLYPPAPMISRVALEEDHFDGKTVPKGALTFINLWALHRHRQHWDRPDAFDPDRFMGARGEAIGRFAFLPFGVGHRVCIGQRFALQEAAVMMAVIFRRYRFEWIEGEPHPWPLMRITTRPEKPLCMQIVRR